MHRRWLTLMVGWLMTGSAPAQVERYDVGRKLIAFEEAWDRQTEPSARKRAVPGLKAAMAAFFGNRLGEAGRHLDEAGYALEAPEAVPPERRWADSLAVRPARRLVDTAGGSCGMTLARLYAPTSPAPAELTVRFALVRPGGPEPKWSAEAPVGDLPLEGAVQWAAAAEGDYVALSEVRSAGQPVRTHRAVISLVKDLDARLAGLRAAVGGLPERDLTAEQLTLRAHVRLLSALARGASPENDFPAARLLNEAEALARLEDRGRFFDSTRPGQYWLTLPTAKANAVVRLEVPEHPPGAKPVPLVVALHGAGGTENWFFECYGHGEIVRQCRQRGWAIAATRSEGFFGAPPVADIVDQLAQRYAIDRARVFLVGHSMGAGQVVALAGSAPDKWAGVVPLAGGGRLVRSDGLRKLPFFVACGTEDFLIRGARALVQSLRDADAERLTAKEYPDIEHITIVQVALPDVFRWFDEIARR
jgi:predicted esterase